MYSYLQQLLYACVIIYYTGSCLYIIKFNLKYMISEEMSTERANQVNITAHSLFSHTLATHRLKSRCCFLSLVQPAFYSPKVLRCNKWPKRLGNRHYTGVVNLTDDLARGYDVPWTMWRCMKRLRMGCTCSKEQRKSWGCYNDDTICACGQGQETTPYLLQCPS